MVEYNENYPWIEENYPWIEGEDSVEDSVIASDLAEALRHVDGLDPDLDGKPSDDMTNGEFAAAIVATEPMQTLARQAAIGAAVERLQQAAMDSGYATEAWSLIALMPDRVQVECHFGTTWDREADTLPAAIAAALGEEATDD